MQQTPSSSAEAIPQVHTASNDTRDIPLSSLPVVSTSKAILSSFFMAMMFVLGLAWIKILLNRATPDGDNIVLTVL